MGIRWIGLAVLFCSSVHAQPAETIEPFGGFAWGSGLYEVMHTAASMEGGILLRWDYRDYPVPDGFSETDLPGLLHKMVKDGPAFRVPDDEFRKRDLRSRVYRGVMEFSSPSGPILSFPESRIAVLVKDSVIISGVPFHLGVGMSLLPGFAIASPEKTVTESGGRFTFPFVLTSVQLSTSSPLLRENISDIYALLSEKYGMLDPVLARRPDLVGGRDGMTGSIAASDDLGHRLSVSSDKNGMYISYDDHSVEPQMEQVYQDFMIEEEAGKLDATKTDRSADL